MKFERSTLIKNAHGIFKDKQAFLFCKDILSIAKNAWKVGYGLLSFNQMCRLLKAYGGRLQTEPIFSNHSAIGG